MSLPFEPIMAGGIAGGIVAYLSKVLIENRLKNAVAHEYDRKIEELKSSLKRETDLEIERVRSELSVAATERARIHSGIYEKQLDILSKVSYCLRKLCRYVEELVSLRGTEHDLPVDELNSRIDALFDELTENFYPNRLYVTDPAVSKLDSFISKVSDIVATHRNGGTQYAKAVGEERVFVDEAIVRHIWMIDEGRQILDEIEIECRKLLGTATKPR